MAKVQYTGPDGLVRHNDKALKHGDVLEVPDHEHDDYLAFGAGKDKHGKDAPGHFASVEAPKPKPAPTESDVSSSSDKTPTTEAPATGDGKE